MPPREIELYDTWKTVLNSKPVLPLEDRFSFLRCKLNDLFPDTRFDAIVSPANSYERLSDSHSPTLTFVFLPLQKLDGRFEAGIAFLLSPAGPTHLTQYIQTHIFRTHCGFSAPGATLLVPLPSDLTEAQSDGRHVQCYVGHSSRDRPP
ncbi:hypothetical protein BD410DRAFT_784965 [Rickenella mellea]|uniref:Uncharacterized protein n=1 Tax=Rickenella mellea TaxID=50990 RepID=A0A4Y7QCZ6_9AGAM|nr:hypothetical protein BD410DRAFT_784965 [Rickenella mellea]